MLRAYEPCQGRITQSLISISLPSTDTFMIAGAKKGQDEAY